MYFQSYCASDSYCSCRYLQPHYPRYNDECPIFNPHHTVYPLCLWWTKERLDYTHTQRVSLISGLQRFRPTIHDFPLDTLFSFTTH